MIRNTLFFIFFLLLGSVTGCASVTTTSSLNSTLSADGVVPYQLDQSGLYTIDVFINDRGPYPFIIDTGATISILFRRTAAQLSIPFSNGETTYVHGIVESSLQPVVRIDNLSFGNISRQNLRTAILENRENPSPPAGIVGMDILSAYTLIFNAEAKTISLIDPDEFDPLVLEGWRTLTLSKNPYSDQDFGLYFLTMELGDRTVPAVLDLGASFSLMNWEAADEPEVRRYRRRQRQNWELEGAVGVFDPSVMVRYDTISTDNYAWKNWDVFVTDLETLEIMGSRGSPLMIAGADMFRDTSFVLDFASQQIHIKPTPSHAKIDARDPRTGSRIGAGAGTIQSFEINQ